MPSPVSLNDIAKRLKLSQMTVSRVLNGTGPASAETTARVLKAAQELGYRRDVFASINARKRAPGLGGRRVLVDWIAEPPDTPSAFSFYSLVALQVLAGLEELGIQTMVSDLTRQGAARGADLAAADAVVFCSPVGPAVLHLVAGFASAAERVVLFQEHAGTLAVNPDNRRGGELAAERMHALGHRHVALYATPDQHNQRARGAAFTERLLQLDPQARIERIAYRLQADGVTASLAAMQAPLATRWLAGGELPSAVFAPGGYATFALYRFLRAQQLAIPQQVGVIGYDSLPFYEVLETPLSHVGFDLAQVTGAAVTAVAGLLAGGEDRAPRTTPCALDERGSLIPLAEMHHALPV